jgi:hypothetical protein
MKPKILNVFDPGVWHFYATISNFDEKLTNVRGSVRHCLKLVVPPVGSTCSEDVSFANFFPPRRV